jgi:putative membrane protein
MGRHSILFGIVSLAAIACNRRTPQPDLQQDPGVVPAPVATTMPGSSMTASGGAASNGAAALTDEQIAAITDDANSAEIEQAKLAEDKAKDSSVKGFASKMVRHHTEAKDKQAKLALKTAMSSLSTAMEKDAADTLSKLKSASGSSFDTTYMNAQVEEHQKVLDAIDQQLLPAVKAENLKTYLNDLRPTVASHLADAKRIQHNLGDTASTR